ncbi:MAG: PLP-dependent aminotransferase family protein [Candidatus Thiodiazotropha sp.]
MGDSELRYEQVATHIRDQVRRGVLRPGERIPSVRALSRRLGVSVSTVVQGYGLLQDERLIEPRPQSGFFVRAQARRPPVPAMSRPNAHPVPVTVSEVALQVVQAYHSPGVIQMGTALPRTDFPAVTQLHRILASLARRSDPRLRDYDMPPGNHRLRLQIARRAVDAGIACTPDEVVVTNGCQEALVLCLRAVAEAGDTVAIESPAFFGTLQAIESLGLKALEIPTDPRYGISLDALRLALEQWPVKAVLLTPNFSNPLGYCMSDARKGELVALLESADVPLIEDDIYADLNYEGYRPRAAKAWDRSGQVLLCSSLSKTLDPGLRIGWALPGRYRDKVVHLKLVNSMASATLPAYAAAEYLESGGHDRHLRALRKAYRERRDRFLELAQRLLPEGSRVTSPDGGFIAWVELPQGTDAMALYHLAMQSGVSIAPGPLFSSSGKYRSFIRLNFGQVGFESMAKGLSILRQQMDLPAPRERVGQAETKRR